MSLEAINTFIGGIMSDNAPIDAPQQAATDLLNAESLSEKGDQVITQPLCSNVPLPRMVDGIVVNEGLPAENILLGVRTHNDIAYLVSGKPSEFQYRKTDKNNRALSPYDAYDKGSALPDGRDITNNTKYFEEKQSFQPEYKIRLGSIRGAGTIWTGRRTVKEENTEDTLRNVFEITKPGEYIIDVDLYSIADDYGSTLSFHELNVRFFLNDKYDPLTDWIETSSKTNTKLEKLYSLSFTTQAGKGGMIKVQYKNAVKDSGIVSLESHMKLRVKKSPGDISGADNIHVDIPHIGKATSNLHSDGFIGIKRTENSDCYMAIENRDFVAVGAGFTQYFYDLPAGTFSIYVKEYDENGEAKFMEKIVYVGQKYTVPDLEIDVKIKSFTLNTEQTEEGQITNRTFDLEISIINDIDFDDYDPYTGQYRFGYTDSELKYVKVQHTQTGNVHTFSGITVKSERILIVSVEAIDPQIIGGIATTFAREVHIEVPITDDLADNNYNLEIGSFPSPDDYDNQKGNLISNYKPLNNLNGGPFICDSITLSGKNYVEMELQPSYDGSVNIIYAEEGKRARIINSGFSKLSGNQYEIIERNNSKNVNRYNNNNVEVATRLVQGISSLPYCRVNKVNSSGGNLEVGMYKYFLRLGTVDDNETDIIEETGYIPILMGDTLADIKGAKAGTRTFKSIEIQLDNIDTMYNHVSLYYIINSGEEVNVVQAYKVVKKYLIPEAQNSEATSITFTHTGFEPREVIQIESLSTTVNHVFSIKTLAQVQNRLFAANVSKPIVDYNRLFKVCNRILGVPSTGSRLYKADAFYQIWSLRKYDNPSVSYNALEDMSHQYYKQIISGNATLPDFNLSKGAELSSVLKSTIISQGFHNPLLVERMAGYWPKETYKYAICWIMDDNTVTQPVPVSGADYSDLDLSDKTIDKLGDLNYSTFNNIYNVQEDDEIEGEGGEDEVITVANQSNDNWITIYNGAQDISFNRIGIVRFPAPVNSSTIYYPKFIFSKKEIESTYPEFFARVKGFFFVRAERKPDVLLSGFRVPCFLSITEENSIVTYGSTDHQQVPLQTTTVPLSALSALPAPVFNSEGLLQLLGGVETYNSGSPYAFASASLQLHDASEAKFLRNSSTVYKHALYSGDILADIPRAVASFNGASLGAYSLSNFVTNNLVKSLPAIGPFSLYYNLIRVTTATGTPILKEFKTVKIITDLVKGGENLRTAGGFASRIPYKAARITLEGGGRIYPTGIFGTYLGFTTSVAMEGNFLFLYPNATGPLSLDAVRRMYSSDESSMYTAITPRYKFHDFPNNDKIEVVGTRGDCFISQNIFSLIHGDIPTTGGPSSHREGLKAQTTDELNSYRSLELSSSLLLPHPTNYLSFARHPEVVDSVETATFGKARGFLPHDGSGDDIIAKGLDDKIKETEAFNKGYKAHFEGRKYVSLSKDSPYISGGNPNTVMFSELYSSMNFTNGYRDFHGINQKEYNKELGAITRLIPMGNNIMSVHAKGVSIIGVNEDVLLQNDHGADVRAGSMEIIADKAQEISSEFGSEWGRSVVKTDNGVYGVDVNRHKIWFTQGKNLMMNSDGKINRLLAGFLEDFAGKKEVPGKLYIASFYDTLKNDVIFTFYNSDSRFFSRAVEMDIETFYLLQDMTLEEREAWVIIPESSEQQMLRKRTLEQFNDISQYSQPVKSMTIVFNENTQTWKTRLSYSPEFAFNVGNRFYSINNKEVAVDFIDNLIFNNDTERHLIWSHGDVHPVIQPYGSFYGKDPVWEIEFVVNANPRYEKTFEKMVLVGNESRPSRVIYQISEDCPWFNVLVNTSDFQFTDQAQMDARYFDSIMNGGYSDSMRVISPNTYIVQDIYDRRKTNIIKANYEYLKGQGIIKISKNLHKMYYEGTWGDIAKKHSLQEIRDKYLRVRLCYTDGQKMYLKAVITTYK